MMKHLAEQDTIIAQCTPQGNGALALVRLSGSQARIIGDKLGKLASGKRLTEVATHTVHYGHVIHITGQILDQVIFIVMDAPRTFTGENVLEITVHNNQFLVDALIEHALMLGARLAQPGEFSRRAVLHGKIDLLQAEAINELIHANSQLGLKKSLEQLEGSLSQWVHVIEKDLMRALAYCEASFEFLDEEADFSLFIQKTLDTILEYIVQCKHTFDVTRQIRYGIRIALIGSVNAGKSSLFNTLLQHNRSIVTPTAGTTRDAIEAGLYRNGIYWTLIDTAGLRQTADIIEQEGIRRSYQEAEKADVILLVIDGARTYSSEEERVYNDLYRQYHVKIIVVITKSDLCANQQFVSWIHVLHDKPIVVSCYSGYNIRCLEDAIQKNVELILGQACQSPFLLNQRQFNLVRGLEHKIRELRTLLLQPPVYYELIAYHLKDALEYLTELSGKSISEAGMDMIFKEFCIGK